jgi:hypothetical protein
MLFWRYMPEDPARDAEFMRAALAEARDAAERGEVPIGAVLTLDNRIIARAGNRRNRCVARRCKNNWELPSARHNPLRHH